MGQGGSPGLAGARGQHAGGRVIGKDRFGRQGMASDGVGQRLQQGSGFADPAGQAEAVQVEPVAVEDLALAIQGKMIGGR